MTYRIAIENIEQDHWVAWLVDLPGCFSRAATQEQALAGVNSALEAYFDWIHRHDNSAPWPAPPFQTEVIEQFHAFTSHQDPNYTVNAFFGTDHRPLTYWEVAAASQLLRWSRSDLMALAGALDEGALNRPLVDPRFGSINAILDHIALAENWCLSHLALGLPPASLPTAPLAKALAMREHTQQNLHKLIGLEQITEDRDEHWSGRKVVRRMLWHERDHTQQIAALLTA